MNAMQRSYKQEMDRALASDYYREVPLHTAEAIERYVMHGLEPGGFLSAVLSNDLMGAVGRADRYNEQQLSTIARFVYNKLPASCHGSSKQVNEWCKTRGLARYTEKI